MENFLPALLIIGGVIYKIYSEYKKEQEKARRRIPSLPSKNAPSTQNTQPIPPIPKPVTVQLPKTEDITQRYADNTVQREGPKKSRGTSLTPKKLELEVLPDDSHEFDLRQAIIQTAILERPYKS